MSVLPQSRGAIPTRSTMIYRLFSGFICISLWQSINIKPANMYIVRARAQFNINTHGCWDLAPVHSRWVISCPVQPQSRLGLVFLSQFQWHERNVLDNWQLAVLPQSGGYWVRSLQGSFLGLYAFTCVRASKSNKKYVCRQYYRNACQVSERYHHYNIQSRGFGNSQDLEVRRLTD